MLCYRLFFFFFQAEDGIRDGHVTGVQTCALPILPFSSSSTDLWSFQNRASGTISLEPIGVRSDLAPTLYSARNLMRSEERRVGKECGFHWSTRDWKKKMV